MRWSGAVELHDVFAQVRLDDAQPRVFERVIQRDLFGRHRLGFDDILDLVFCRDLKNQRARFRRIARPMHVPTGSDH